MNPQEYWAQVRAIEKTIPDPFVLVISLDKPKLNITGGAIFWVSRYNAARLIANETHRLCSSEEAAAYQAAQEAARAEAAARDAARDLFVATLPDLAHRVARQGEKKTK